MKLRRRKKKMRKSKKMKKKKNKKKKKQMMMIKKGKKKEESYGGQNKGEKGKVGEAKGLRGKKVMGGMEEVGFQELVGTVNLEFLEMCVKGCLHWLKKRQRTTMQKSKVSMMMMLLFTHPRVSMLEQRGKSGTLGRWQRLGAPKEGQIRKQKWCVTQN
ncbi:hypothetical protein DVH24_005737 [Malus domestica]|uniref:Uncharacterized protein n=1 Tax=Malus domestica TaxID=3750 RepID=A0A498IMR9_MALDO|nr:hypothetical protein DVH24_005737 [Malus domestica]